MPTTPEGQKCPLVHDRARDSKAWPREIGSTDLPRPHPRVRHASTDHTHKHHQSVALRHMHTSVSSCQMLTHRLRERARAHACSRRNELMQEPEASELARVSASEMGFGSMVARPSKESALRDREGGLERHGASHPASAARRGAPIQ